MLKSADEGQLLNVCWHWIDLKLSTNYITKILPTFGKIPTNFIPLFCPWSILLHGYNGVDAPDAGSAAWVGLLPVIWIPRWNGRIRCRQSRKLIIRSIFMNTNCKISFRTIDNVQEKTAIMWPALHSNSCMAASRDITKSTENWCYAAFFQMQTKLRSVTATMYSALQLTKV